MNISQLVAFQAVMTSSTLSEAANKIGRTQPAVSAAIKALEDRLGLKLFERRGRNLLPVPEARYLLAEADEILSQVDRIQHTMQSLVGGMSGKLSVAAMPGPVSMLFPRFVAEHLAPESVLSISLSARSSAQIAELARAQSIDFGFADFPDGSDGTSLYTTQEISGRCFVAVPRGHALATKTSISFRHLSGLPMGSLQPNHPHQREVQRRFDADQLTFAGIVESQTFLPILQFVLAGRCCAILDPLTVVHARQSPEISEGMNLLRLNEDLRYRYAIMSPLHRPVPVLAEDLKSAWVEEVVHLLEDIDAEPQVAGGSPERMVSP